MSLYIKEIPGTKNERNEDSHFATTFSYEEREFSLAIVADGCSGYNGSVASHIVTHDLGHKIRERIISGEKDYTQMIRTCVEETNTKLHKMSSARSTLDLLLLTTNYGCIAHAGDGRVYAHTAKGLNKLTVDELAHGEPTNYLGAYFIGDKGLLDRLSISVLSEKELKDTKGFLLATDGLWSRVQEQYFLSLFQNSDNITKSFELMDKEVYLPQLKIKGLNEARIKAEFGDVFTSLNLPLDISAAELSAQLYSLYIQRNPIVVERVDKKVVPFDDTTLVYVDRFNVVDSLFLERSQMKGKVIPGLEERISGLEQELVGVKSNLHQRDVDIETMKARFDEEKKGLELRYNGLQEQYGVLSGDYSKVCAQREELNGEKERLIEERDGLISEKGDLEQKGSITDNLMDELSHFIDSNGLSKYIKDKIKHKK